MIVPVLNLIEVRSCESLGVLSGGRANEGTSERKNETDAGERLGLSVRRTVSQSAVGRTIGRRDERTAAAGLEPHRGAAVPQDHLVSRRVSPTLISIDGIRNSL